MIINMCELDRDIASLEALSEEYRWSPYQHKALMQELQLKKSWRDRIKNAWCKPNYTEVLEQITQEIENA